MQITFLGGAREIGRNSVLLETEKTKLLLDYGIEVQEMKTPIMPDARLDGILISHAHLDHIGFVPEIFTRGYKGNVFSTPVTHDLSLLLLYDSLKVQQKRGEEPYFSERNIEAMYKTRRNVKMFEMLSINDAFVRFAEAGHVPGSSAITVESKGHAVLYTGDIKFTETRLMNPAYSGYKNINTLICESTYLYKDHPSRKELEKELKTKIIETTENGGTVLMPSFAVGRTQELLLILAELDVSIYMDGMGIEATEIILSHPDSVKDFKKLKNAFGKAKKIERAKQRKEAIKKPCVILTTAGMLNGGPIHFYLKRLYKNESCRLILTGYQAEGTVGRMILDTGIYSYREINKKIKMEIDFMDFSAHCGRTNLINFIKKISPENVFLMHSDKTPEYAEELKEEGINAIAPKNGDIIKL